MKKVVLLIFFVAAIGLTANAQNMKFGHINTQELVSLMSEMDSAQLTLQAYSAELSETYDGMTAEYNGKIEAYQQKSATWTPVVKETKEKEIQELVQRIQQFEQTAQQELQQQQQILFAPIFQKARAAVEKVAKAQNLVYVFEVSTGALTYKDDTQSLDLLPLAKAELGIPAEKVAPTQLPQQTPAAE